jgi:hypothetical protein
MIVVDNLMPMSFQNNIKAALLEDNFPWYFQRDITAIGGADQAPGFSHVYKHADRAPDSRMFDLVSLIAYMGADNYGFDFKHIVQARSFLQVPLANNILTSEVDALHVDLPIDHLVVLYYVCDSDGDTILVDKKFNKDEGMVDDCRYTDYKIIKRVTPKKGRCLIFDGAYYHTAEQPKNNTRCVINFNLI